MLKFSLWDDRINSKKSTGTYPFQLVYGTYSIFPTQLGLPILKFLQEELEEPNGIQRMIFQIIEIQQRREMLNEKYEAHQRKIKVVFYKNTKKYDFEIGDLILRWDVTREEK